MTAYILMKLSNLTILFFFSYFEYHGAMLALVQKMLRALQRVFIIQSFQRGLATL